MKPNYGERDVCQGLLSPRQMPKRDPSEVGEGK